MFTWQDERWHWADVPIHAGSMWGLVLPEGTLTVRIETAKRGESWSDISCTWAQNVACIFRLSTILWPLYCRTRQSNRDRDFKIGGKGGERSQAS